VVTRSRNEFRKIPLNGDTPVEMLHGRVPVRNFAWLGNSSGNSGTRLVTDPGNTGGQLSLVDLAAGTSWKITASASNEVFPAPSPYGKRLAFASGEVGYDIVEVPLDGSGPRDVIATSRSEVAPAWARDGTRFAYLTDRSGVQEIWLRNRADGS